MECKQPEPGETGTLESEHSPHTRQVLAWMERAYAAERELAALRSQDGTPITALEKMAATWRKLADDFEREVGHDEQRRRYGIAASKTFNATRLRLCANELEATLKAETGAPR